MGKASKMVSKEVKQEVKKRTRKIRTSIRFRRPKTRKTVSKPALARRPATTTAKKEHAMIDYNSILIQPVVGDKNTQKMEKDNIITFIVSPKANKNQIKEAFSKVYKVSVGSVNTLNTIKGKKKAYIRMKNDKEALNLATKIGIL